MANINNPHDKFFKESFSRLEVVKSFIEEVFPKEFSDKINLETLQLTNASFIDADLSEHLADLVYQTQFASQEVLVTLLFEHKSYTESFPHWQLLRYMTNIWIEEQKQEKQPSVVIPIIIHHGKVTWKKKPMRSYFGNIHSSLVNFLPEFDYLLFSLNTWEDYQIANFKNIFLSTTAMLLKHSRDEKEAFLKLESFWIEKLKALDEAHEVGFISSIFKYIDNGINLTRSDLIIIFTKVSTTVNNIAMTIAEEIKIEERENLTINYVKGLFEKGLQAEFIADAFKLPLQKVEEIIQKIKSSAN
ncbi:putative transposase/invertase (TIGR01784 family) [Arcicella aurantiaca]|uniref:Putative transposase/invertase (TIGR01784 family) n=1 Tax=Arcicella aurantiaca TaxID=591202 RepID=A0A316DJV3_9BACT|nr:Rpn family recombination-promoting nuclease/putative transposase [Arcicella aurantiaca]PWK18401.1 putative transposase/invertase (TIGR01784 family) [Arcicella aurantiaca]